MSKLNLATMSTSKNLAYMLEVRLRNLLYKVAAQTKNFYANKQHLVMTSGIINESTGLDLGVIRYSVYYKYVKGVVGNSGGAQIIEPTHADIYIEVGFANTGARLAANTAITLNTGTVIERSNMAVALDGTSSTLRFQEFSKILTALEALDLLTAPTLVVTEGDETKYKDVIG